VSDASLVAGSRQEVRGAASLLHLRTGADLNSAVAGCVHLMSGLPRLAAEIDLRPPAELLALHQYVRRSEAGTLLPDAGSARRPADVLVDLWRMDGSALGLWAETCFLETDLASNGTPGGTSVFFRGSADAGRHHAEAIDSAVRYTLGHAVADRAAMSIGAIGSCLPPRAEIGSLGLMSGRGGSVRLNVTGLSLGALTGFAYASDLQGFPEDGAALFDLLVETADKVTLALDLYMPAGSPPLLRLSGFECFIEEAFETDSRWDRLAAIARGRCEADAAAVERVLASPCRILPGDPAVQWPDAWLLDALMAPPGRVPSARVWISHFKFMPATAGGGWRTKAYVAAERVPLAAPAPLPSWPSSTPARDVLVEARDAGVRFLLRRQDQAGLWRDFVSPLGAGDEWPSAVIAYCLVGTGPDGHAAAMRAQAALRRRQRPSGGWGFNAWTPQDADSTAWYLHLSRALGLSGGASEDAARAFVARHVSPDGGVATYAAETPIRFDGSLEGCDDSGFRASHGCVSAAAAALVGEPTRAFVTRFQAADGSLPGYWWDEPTYPTALALVLAEGAPAIDAARGAAWLSDLPNEGMQPFAAAWRLAGIAASGQAAHAAAGKLAGLLVASQRQDGGWRGGACMRTPDPWVVAPAPGEGRIDLDVRGLFTTAGAVLALDLLIGACGL